MDNQMASSAMPISGPDAGDDLADEIEKADCIVAGTVTQVSDATGPVSLVSAEARPADDQLCKAEIAVIRTIACDRNDDPTTVFFLRGKTPSRSWKELTEGQTVLLFLRAVDGGYIPVASTGNPIKTLASIDTSPSGTSKSQAVAHELEQIILQADPALALEMIVHAAIARAHLRDVAKISLLDIHRLQNSVQRVAWIAIALAEGQFEALKDLTEVLEDTDLQQQTGLESLLINGVSRQVATAARPHLAALIQSSRTNLAHAAAMSLRQLHSREAIPDLALGLYHADQGIRYQSVMGLSELEPTVEPGPSFDLYQKNESYYLNRWKQWWEDARPGFD